MIFRGAQNCLFGVFTGFVGVLKITCMEITCMEITCMETAVALYSIK